MTTSASNIAVVLSGGGANLNPNLSLGGDPSSTPVASASLNNLFADLSPSQTLDGREDYRCIYFFNDGDTAIFNIALWVSTNLASPSTVVELGINDQNERQRLTITGGVSGGSLTLDYDGHNFTTNYQVDLAAWATALQEGLLGLMDGDNAIFHDVTVIASNAGSTVIFDVLFAGLDAQRSFDLLTVASNDLTPDVSVVISKQVIGAPINSIAPEIDLDTTPPGGVGFFVPSEQSPITLPVLYADDGFPLWVKRVTPANTAAQADDGFVLTFRAESAI